MMKAFLSLLFLFTVSLLYGQETSLSPADEEIMNLYPNPVAGEVVHILTPAPGPKSVTVFDVFGKIVLRDRVTNDLYVDKLPPGVYLIQVQQHKATFTRKLIVK